MVLTTATKVRAIAQFSSGDYTDEEIDTEIDIVEAELYNRYNLPKRSQFTVDDDYTDFYIYPDKVYDIIRVQASVETTLDPSGYISLSSGSDYIHTPDNNYITLSTETISEYDSKIVRVQHIPKIFSIIAGLQTALNLLEPTTIIDGDAVESPKITQLKNRLIRYKKLLMNGKKILRSSQYDNFDKYQYISYTQSDLR